MTSIPGPQIVSVESGGDGCDDGVDDANDVNGANNNANNAYAKSQRDSHGDNHANNQANTHALTTTNTPPINLQVYDYAIREAVSVIDQLGWKNRRTDIQGTTPFANHAASHRKSKLLRSSRLFLRPTPCSSHCFWKTPSCKHRYPFDWLSDENQDVFVLLEGKRTMSIAKLKVLSFPT